MFANELKNFDIPAVSLTTKIGYALKEMADYKVYHLPVIEPDNTCLGVVAEEDLMHHDYQNDLSEIIPSCILDIKILSVVHIYQ
ncbi:MAG: CBS domain-containing protein, partial [Bacteroidales bacterium]